MDNAATLIALGCLFLLGLAADQLGHRTRLPRVTLLLFCGVALGAPGLNMVPDAITAQYDLLSIIALTMVAFLLGGTLSAETLRAHGRAILSISLCIVIVTLVVVATGLWLLGADPATALILGAIATATAPAATYDVIRQTGITNGFTDTLKGIVAIDDAWGLIAFSLVLLVATEWAGTAPPQGLLAETTFEVLGSIALGLFIGLPGAALTGRLSDGEPLRIEALGLVFLTAGLALHFELSYLIAGMTAGTVIVNLASHHTKAFHEIENIQWPFMLVFFILAGATLDPAALAAVTGIGLGYIVLRTLARLLGGWLGATLARAPAALRPWYGPALLPQAGVAIGMSLVAGDALPDRAAQIGAVTIGSTILFELLGPLVSAWAIRRASSRQT